MKKRLVTFFIVSVMALSFAVPAMAMDAVVSQPINAELEQEVSPFFEMTRIYLRNHHGVLQFRVWSITNGRWLTEWADL